MLESVTDWTEKSKHMHWIKSLFFFLSLVVGCNSIGQSIITDRPTQTVSTEVVPLGGVQLEAGMGIAIVGTEETQLSSRSFHIPTTLIRLPLLNRLEFRLENTVRYSRVELEESVSDGKWLMDDLQAGFKWKITGGGSNRPQIALMSHAVIPTGSSFNKSFGVINKLLISRTFENGVNTTYNLGYDYLGEDNAHFTYAASITFPVHKSVSFYFEPFGTFADAENFIINTDAGLTFLIKDKYQLDYSFGVGLNNRMNYQALGFSVLFN